jgi:hypothetical protein
VDSVPDPLLLRKSGSAGNRTRTSGSVARNSDHNTVEESHSGLAYTALPKYEWSNSPEEGTA